MPEERSAGFVVFRKEAGKRLYLLLQQEGGRWDFPKGNIEAGETSREAALRELKEETGIKWVRQVNGFDRRISYFYKKDGKTVHKEVVFFLGEAADSKVAISHEHTGYGWFTYEEAMARLKFENAKQTLEKAEKFLQIDH